MNRGRIVILGNGGAAAFAAVSARASGYQGEIHLVSDTATPAFNPMLSPYYLKGEIPWDRCFPFGAGFYRDYNLTRHFDNPVESLDAAAQRVTLAKGRKLVYDRCLVATGAGPAIAPVPGLKESPRCLPLRTAASMKRLEEAMSPAKRALVLGASLVGLKVAEMLIKKRIHVILLDVADRLLPQRSHASSAALLKSHFERHGADVRLGCTMEGVEDVKEGVLCRIAGSAMEKVDFVAVCTGVRPNLGFLVPGQVGVDQAILVDERMETGAAHLYAAGDASQGINPLSGRHEWFGAWGNACSQGRVAGANMAGRDVTCPGSIPQNVSPFFGWVYTQMGEVEPQGRDVRHVVLGGPGQEGHGVLAFEGSRLTGFNLIDLTHFAGPLRSAMLRKQDWGPCLDRADQWLTGLAMERMLHEIMGRGAQHSHPSS